MFIEQIQPGLLGRLITFTTKGLRVLGGALKGDRLRTFLFSSPPLVSIQVKLRQHPFTVRVEHVILPVLRNKKYNHSNLGLHTLRRLLLSSPLV